MSSPAPLPSPDSTSSKPGPTSLNSVKAQRLAANLSVWDFIFGSRVIDSANLSNAEIALQTLPKGEEEKKSTLQFAISVGKKALDGVSVSNDSPLLKVPNYTVKDLQLSDVSIHVDDRSVDTPTTYDIEIASFQATPLRSHFAIFDYSSAATSTVRSTAHVSSLPIQK